MNRLDELCINTLRFLAVDGVEKAKSGHPGLPLGAAPMAYVVWDRFLRHNPANPSWFNRDRFILSAGHGSMLLYALLHVYGYDLPLEELKNFRQWGSKTPGHPEYGHTPGVEATTGPLGQGFAMGVGLAIAEHFLGEYFNAPAGEKLVDHYVYALVSDGDLMEGISSEAASLAGRLGLGKLIYLYDDNGISIEGHTDLAFTEDVAKRFEAYDWQVLQVADGNDLEAIDKAIRAAQAEAKRPSLIIVPTHIGFGSPKQDTAAVHGEAMGAEAARKTKENLGWPLEPDFYIPQEALAHFRRALETGKRLEAEWQALLANYRKGPAQKAEAFDNALQGKLPADWDKAVPVFDIEKKAIATRDASGQVMTALAKHFPTLLGGSADLSPSTKTTLVSCGEFGEECGRNIHFGVREHAMAGCVNGMALHGGVLPYGSTFMVFADYMRPSLRLAAIMGCHSIFVFTHDSIGVGEDGPTHQPVEHLMSFRLIPGLTVIRPADANETAAAWKLAVQLKGPVVFALTRQKLPILEVNRYPVAEGMPRGAYILAEAENGKPELIIIATGSEVHLALAAREQLSAQGRQVRVVSMPSWELFEKQSEDYRNSVLLPAVPKLAVEAGSTLGWQKYVGDKGTIIGLDRFGASAPLEQIMKNLGFSVERVVHEARALLAG
jgi:transketolase